MNLLYTLDKNYIEQLIVSIGSVLRFKTDEGYDVYIMQTDFSIEDKERINRSFSACSYIRLHYVEMSESLFSGFPKNNRYPKTMYYRILAAKLLPPDMDRILYLDPDVIAINSPKSIYGMDISQKYFAACTHTGVVLTSINRKRLGITDERPYINTGVMLINLPLLREKQSFEEIKEFILMKQDNFILPDQDIITALYGDKVLIIDSMIYNLNDRLLIMKPSTARGEATRLDYIAENTVFIHYYGRNKPWNKGYIGILDKFYNDAKCLDYSGDNICQQHRT